jgi:hypothetical protein
MTIVFKPAHAHNYRSSAYERKANDFYPTPSELAIGVAVGLSRLGLHLPKVALDPCGGDGALRRSLAHFGVDVRLSDLYPERYLGADGYIGSQPLDAAEPEQLGHALTLAGPNCSAIITNTPHNTDEACAIARNLITLVEGQQVDLSPRCSGQSGVPNREGCPTSTGLPFSAKSFVVGALDGFRGLRKAQCMHTRGTSGGRSHGAAHPQRFALAGTKSSRPCHR